MAMYVFYKAGSVLTGVYVKPPLDFNQSWIMH